MQLCVAVASLDSFTVAAVAHILHTARGSVSQRTGHDAVTCLSSCYVPQCAIRHRLSQQALHMQRTIAYVLADL
jgi:hypothetical protein